MSTYAQMALDKRNKAIADMRAILDKAAEEQRDLTPEEIEQTERADAEADRYSAELKRAARADELAAMSAELRGQTGTIVEGPTRPEPETISERDLFRKGWAAARAGDSFGYDLAEIRSAAPSEGFLKAMEMRALQSAGGSAVPVTFSEKVYVYQRTATPMLDPSVVTIMETSTGEDITLPRWTADVSHGGTVTAQAGGILEADPTISSVTLRTHKYAVTSLWSSELSTDNVINLEDMLAQYNGRELTIDLGAHLTTGTGTVQPNGIVTAASNAGTANGTADGHAGWTFVGPHDLIDLYYSLAAPYRNAPGAGWMANATAIAKMRKFRDSNNQFLWDNSMVIGAPDTFNGRPVYENPGMASPASATKSFIFGDLKAYITRRMPLQVRISAEYKFSTDQIALRTIVRASGDLPDVAAIKYIVSADT